MAFDPNNYLDIWNIVLWEIVGGPTLMLALGTLIIAFIIARCQIPFQAGLILIGLWIGVFSILTSQISLWSLVVFGAGGFFYWVMSRMWRRN